MKLFTLILTCCILTACNGQVHHEHVVAAEVACATFGGWKTIDDATTSVYYGPFEVTVTCKDGTRIPYNFNKLK